MIKRRNFIWLVPLALITTFPAWRIPVSKFLTPRSEYDYSVSKTAGNSQNFNLETVKILQSKNGMITAEIRAKNAFTNDTPDEYTLAEVDADLYNNEGQPTNVKAQRGVFNSATQRLTLMEDVVITKVTADQRLYTDLLYYNDNERIVNCPGKTRIISEDIDITGTGLDYDIEKGLYELGGRVLCLISGSISP